MTTTVSFVKLNNTHGRVVSNDEGALRTLKNHFTFMVPNARFNPKVRQKKWDGKIRLLKPNGTIYYGLKEEIRRLCEDKGWTFQDIDHPGDTDFPSRDDVLKFCDSLHLQSGGEPITVREYQLQYITHALQNGRALLLCPTSGGKSLIAYVIIRWALAHGMKRGLIVVPSVNLVSQMAHDFVDYGWDEHEIHTIYEGAEKHSDCPLTISTWQGIQNEVDFFKDFEFVIGDEAHIYKAKSLVSIMENCINASLRIGMSGTLDGAVTSQMVIEGLFGCSYRVVKTQDLIEQGYSAELDIKCIVLNHPPMVRQHFTELKPDYDKETDFLTLSKRRTNFIARMSLTLKGNTMVFFQYKEHGKALVEAMVRLGNEIPGKTIYYIDGDTKTEDREMIRKMVEVRNDIVVVVSYGTTSVGANYKSLHNMIFASAFKSIVRTLQSIGRGLRKSKTKNHMTIYDVADNLSWSVGKQTRENFTLTHFKDRLAIYSNEGFRFKVMEIDL